MKKRVRKTRVTKASSLEVPMEFAKRNGWEIKDANADLELVITEAHVRRAKCKDPGKCVVAQALRDHFHGFVEEFLVGPRITKLINRQIKQCVRYSTSGKLAASLRHFDKTKKWDLPPGTYVLRALCRSYRRPARWEKARRMGGKQSTFKGTPVAPTRHAVKLNSLIKK